MPSQRAERKFAVRPIGPGTSTTARVAPAVSDSGAGGLGPPLPSGGRTQPVKPSALLARVQAFLGTMKRANEELEVGIRENGREKYDIETLGDDGSSSDSGDSDSESSDREGEPVTLTKDGVVRAKAKGQGGKKKKKKQYIEMNLGIGVFDVKEKPTGNGERAVVTSGDAAGEDSSLADTVAARTGKFLGLTTNSSGATTTSEPAVKPVTPLPRESASS